jgi:hypothetical protein
MTWRAPGRQDSARRQKGASRDDPDRPDAALLERFRGGDEPIAAAEELADELRQGADGLAAVAAAVVQEDDRAGSNSLASHPILNPVWEPEQTSILNPVWAF